MRAPTCTGLLRDEESHCPDRHGILPCISETWFAFPPSESGKAVKARRCVRRRGHRPDTASPMQNTSGSRRRFFQRPISPSRIALNPDRTPTVRKSCWPRRQELLPHASRTSMAFAPQNRMGVVGVSASQGAEVIDRRRKPDAKHAGLSAPPFFQGRYRPLAPRSTPTGPRQIENRVDADDKNFCLNPQGLESLLRPQNRAGSSG